MDFLTKEIFGILSILLTVFSYTPYFWGMLKGTVKPHIFTWIIWAISCAIAAAAQYSDHAGAGTFSNITSAILAVAVIGLAVRQRSDWSITRSDWVALLCGLTIIPLWYVTQNALTAALLATLVDISAYYPTLRKSWHRPYEEKVSLYGIANIKHAASIAATAHYSWTTVIMPAATLAVNCIFIALLLWRRRVSPLIPAKSAI